MGAQGFPALGSRKAYSITSLCCCNIGHDWLSLINLEASQPARQVTLVATEERQLSQEAAGQIWLCVRN